MPLMTPIALKIFCLESCCCSATQLCLTLCDPMDCSTPSFPVFPCLLEFAQTHVHWVDDDIQPSHPSPPSFNISQNQGKISSESAVHIRWPQYWSFNFSISPSNEYSGLFFFRIEWFDLLAVGGLSRVFSSTVVWKHQFFSMKSLYCANFTSIHDYRKNHNFDICLESK